MKSRWTARSTVFAAAILIVGSIALFLHDMNGHEYVLLAGTVHAFIVARAVGEDVASKQNAAPKDEGK
jgi:hypothetical protein